MTMNRVGMYAASFDPVTLGHMDIISRATTLFDILVVVVGQNPKKVGSYSFDLGTRSMLVRDACNHMASQPDWKGRGQVMITRNDAKLTVRFAESYGLTNFGFPVKAFVRGVRNAADFQKELDEFNTTLEIAPGIEFVPLFCKPHLSHVSSSMVKGLVGFDGWEDQVRRYLPEPVRDYFINSFQHAGAK